MTEKEAIAHIQRKFGRSISRRTYYYYKSKIWKKNVYGDIEPRSLFQKFEYLPLLDRKSILIERNPDILINEEEDKLDFIPKHIHKLTNKLDSLISGTQSYQDKSSSKRELQKKKIQANNNNNNNNNIPSNATKREEYVFCRKSGCFKEHGPYYYAYWRNKENDGKLKKKYLGPCNPR